MRPFSTVLVLPNEILDLHDINIPTDKQLNTEECIKNTYDIPYNGPWMEKKVLGTVNEHDSYQGMGRLVQLGKLLPSISGHNNCSALVRITK
jgi:hypothetical protein